MGEDQILQLSKEALQTPSGKSLLGNSLNLTDILNRIQELSTKYNIDLSTLKETSVENVNSSLGSNLTRDQRRENRNQKRLTAKERLQERLNKENITGVTSDQKVRAEILLLKSKLRSQIPILQDYTITGRLQDKNTNTPIQGAKVTLGVNVDIIQQNIAENPLDVNENLIPQNNPLNLNDLVFIPVISQSDRTDKQGNFSIKVKIPIIPENQKTPLTLSLLYSKSGYIPGTQAIINGDKTIKTNLSLNSLINIKESSKDIVQEYNDNIDKAQSSVASLSMGIFDRIISAKKFSIGKIVEAIKTKLIPLLITLLISFGISKLSQKNRKTCPTPEALKDVIRTRNRVVRQLNQIYKMIIVNTSLSLAFTSLAKVLKGVRLSLDKTPIPLSIGGPGPVGLIFSQTYSFVAKLQHINDNLEKLEEQNKDVSKATLTSLVFVIAGATTAIILLKSIDQMIQECAEENGTGNLELEVINQELLDLSVEESEDGNPVLSNVNGFIFSVETDNSNPVGTLKRRFAVAKDSRGTILLRGEPSFSSSDQILIDELVFYIQQNDLKAN